MAEMLQTRLLETIREDLGGTYSVSVSANYSKVPREEYELIVQFGSSPMRVEELAKVVMKQIDQFKASGPTPKPARGREGDTVAVARDAEQNQCVSAHEHFASAIEYGEDLETLFNLTDYYNKLTAAMVQAGGEDVSQHRQLRHRGTVS